METGTVGSDDVKGQNLSPASAREVCRFCS
jgi:hypothetical protein